MTRFDYCVDFVLNHETEYDTHGIAICEHDKNDPGGDTKYGIDQRSHPKIKICDLTLEQAKQIYHDGEWTKCQCDKLPAGWDLAVFDAAVNLGAGWAIPAMQRAIGVRSDGVIGPITLSSVTKAGKDDLEVYLQMRENHYRNLRPELVKSYIRGWLARVDDLRKPIAISMMA